jgi:hypothetical protein
MKMSLGIMALTTNRLPVRAHKGRRVRPDRPAKKEQKAIRVRQGPRVPQAAQAAWVYGS